MPYGLRKAPRGHRYRVQRRIPDDLQPLYLAQRQRAAREHNELADLTGKKRRAIPTRARYVERYLGTSDRAEARRQAEKVWSELGAEFERIRHGTQTVADLEDRVRRLVTVWTWERLRADPREEGPVAADIDSMAAWEHYGRLACEHYGAAYEGGNMDPADNGALLGLEAGLSLFRRGIQPADAPTGAVNAAKPLEAPQRPADEALTVMAAFDAYRITGGRTAGDRTVKQAQASARLLADAVGHKTRIEDVTTRDVSRLRDTLRSISPGYRRDPDLSELDLHSMASKWPAAGDDRLSPETVNRHLSNIRRMFTVLIADGYLPRGHDNPAAGVNVPKAKGAARKHKEGAKVRPLSDNEIDALLVDLPELPDGPPRGFKQCARAAVLLAAHTGMRLGEIAAVRPGNLSQLPDGHWIIDVPGTKTDNAPRRVALPRSLDHLGRWVKRCPDGPLGKSTKHFSESFAKHRRDAGIPDAGADGRVAQFRSLRKSYRSKLAAAKVEADTINCLMGHERDFGAAHYSPDGPPDDERARVADLVSYGQ